jgi:hypothetical protein
MLPGAAASPRRRAAVRWPPAVIGLAGLAAGLAALSLIARPFSQPAPSPAAPPPGAQTSAPPAAESETTPLTLAAPAGATPVQTEVAPAWMVPRGPWYGPDGTRTITLQLEALSDLMVGRIPVRPILAVRCLAHRTEGYVALNTPARIEPGDAHTVTVQFDDELPVTEKWLGSASYQELFAPDGLAFTRRLVTTRLLRFRFTPHNSRPVVAEFATAGFDQVVGNISRLCRWPVAQTTSKRRR